MTNIRNTADLSGTKGRVDFLKDLSERVEKANSTESLKEVLRDLIKVVRHDQEDSNHHGF